MPTTASQIKALRARTGAGMLDCKQALDEAGGDMEAAAQALRTKGIAAAEGKAGRIAAEGVIAAAVGDGGDGAGVLVEVNCETDFVAKDASFRAFAEAAAGAILAAPAAPADVESAGELPLGDSTVDTARRELIGKIGENIALRRFARLDAGDGALSTYLHGVRIGVLVRLGGGDGDSAALESLGRDLAMHIAATRPLCVGEDDVPADTLAREQAIFTAQAAESGKPPEIAQKMVAGRMKKFLKENTLLGQAFVKNPEQTVAQLLKAAGASVEAMVRFEVGEGLEKRSEDFVAEVRAQAAGRT
ncbi:MAG: translation elongation factor Ts [Gammaproteobacteria bacterium]|nr:translation elongation factor Ts [Gammaproteobacteria bacterium]